jgi:hypothetical protein
MNAENQVAGSFNEEQSLQLIREMIRTSQKRLRNDGILFIVWGWINFINYMSEYLLGITGVMQPQKANIKYAGIALTIAGLAFTVVYIYRQRQKVSTYIGASLRYVWVSLFICLVLVNLVQFNVLHEINFELQHPIFMVMIAFATVVTGGILRYKMIISGGIVFGILALLSSYLPLQPQLLLEAIAWLIAFIVPGHILYAGRKK